jgi:hypothetical protein
MAQKAKAAKSAKDAKAKVASKPVSRKPERSKGELSSEDLDHVSGGILIGLNVAPEADGIKKMASVPSVGGAAVPPIKILPM